MVKTKEKFHKEGFLVHIYQVFPVVLIKVYKAALKMPNFWPFNAHTNNNYFASHSGEKWSQNGLTLEEDPHSPLHRLTGFPLLATLRDPSVELTWLFKLGEPQELL